MKRLGAIVLTIVSLWICEVPAAMPAPHIVVLAGNSEALLVKLPLGESCGFRLEFMNSIYNAPVKETLTAGPDGMITVSVIESSSAGVFEYYGLQTDGTGRAVIRRTFQELRILSHDYGRHRIGSDLVTIDLKDFAVNGSPVVIRVGDPGECPITRER